MHNTLQHRQYAATAYTVASATMITGTTTLNIGSHSLLVGDRITITGASPSSFNGLYATITAVDATHVSYAPGGTDTWVSGGSVVRSNIQPGGQMPQAVCCGVGWRQYFASHRS